jgi:DNA processing protein
VIQPIRVLTALDSDWPRTLGDVSPTVASLCALGDTGLLAGTLVAVVGTRQPSEYGRRVTEQLVRALVEADVTIVSGLARGIDGIAHSTALDAGGRTIAVLGTGVDVPYPAGHRALHERIATQGLLLSEVRPGTRAFPGCFPRRNRIIAGLSSVTLVVEAGTRSGAQNTAAAAIACDRIVAAVPGPIDAPQSAGTNLLIRDGAQIVTCVGDLYALVGLGPPRAERVEQRLQGDERVLWSALASMTPRLDELPELVALPIQRVLAGVTALELAGHVTVGLDDRVRRTVPAVHADDARP